MSSRYYILRVPISAIFRKPDGDQALHTIPAGAVLRESPKHSTTLIGMLGVYWEGRHYSVAFNDLFKKADLVKSA